MAAPLCNEIQHPEVGMADLRVVEYRLDPFAPVFVVENISS
jgi:hypothetical protein